MTKKKLASVSFEPEIFEQLEIYAKSKGLTISSAIRIMVYDYLDNNAKNEKTT